MALDEEELSRRWERINLSSEESSIYQVPHEAEKKFKGTHCILSRVLSEKGVNNEAFRKTMSQVWRLDSWV